MPSPTQGSRADLAESASSDDRVLVIGRVLAAPRERVFDAWTQRDHLLRWFGPKDFAVLDAHADPRVGGTWRAGMRSPEGADYWHGGVYREVVPHERLVLTHTWDENGDDSSHETVITLTFDELPGGKTRMTFRQERFKTVASRDSHEEGWNEAFDRLVRHVQG